MSLQILLERLLVWGIYPVWLLAGAGDYLCHRQSDIEHTSGSTESWFHVLQFLTLLIAIAAGALLAPNAPVYGVMIVAVVAHSTLAHLDVSYTNGRRYISPVEQLVHGFLNVLPLVAVAIFGVLYWQQIGAGLAGTSLTAMRPGPGGLWLLGSFIVVAGLPILEELLRTLRHHAGLATIR